MNLYNSITKINEELKYNISHVNRNVRITMGEARKRQNDNGNNLYCKKIYRKKRFMHYTIAERKDKEIKNCINLLNSNYIESIYLKEYSG